MKRVLSILLAALLLFTVSANAAVPGISTKAPSPTPARPSGTAGFTIRPIDWDTAVMGQYALPDGYTAVRIINNCDENTTLGHPVRVSVILDSKADDARMKYYYGEDYIQRVYSSHPLLQHEEGGLDLQTMSFMRTYVDADGYCDALAREWAADAVYYRSEDMSACAGRLNDNYELIRTDVAPGLATYGMYVDWIETTAAQRVYTYTENGKKYCICVMAEVDAYRYSSTDHGASITNIVWQVPCYYVLWCPFESYERIHDGAFSTFVENTSVNDEMMALNDRLTAEIAQKVITEINMMCAASSAYMASMTALTFSMVENSMSYTYTGSYSSDRFSDYMFDQNDYTTSSGSSVKVPTSYSYVWEGGNGTIYYGNSLSDAPGGATRLYANP